MNRKLIVIAFLFLSVQMFSHGNLSERILIKTIEILENPNNYRLYYERGFLYQQHVDYEEALADYVKSESLGNSNKDLKLRMAEIHYLTEDYCNALAQIEIYLDVDSIDVIAKKLEAKILFKLKAYEKSIKAYRYVMNNMIDVRPEDILEYANIILAENNKNYEGALDVIEFGLQELGPNTLSLQLKKLEFLKEFGQVENAIEQYNYFILQYKRKEFWYYKKAKYLSEIDKPFEAKIALKLATSAIANLDSKYQHMTSIIELKDQIKNLESLNNQKL
ncbi:hypothetical protein JQC67_08605 [Aurantibacter crassamenti]|uniref:tetratricopeptide repeat protein n=1 Tax=Aurantibacter crassamenti TaxID=1837375 RepID=UPI00193969FA|nr:hypothetical protein [Aurantibacter crassamenti]MBM1106194.1 hypothetical protein [Aurantibacter crassamenti]